jgi:hypothetical protein
MPTATTAPVSPLARLRGKLSPLPPPTAIDRARWARAARRRPVVTDDAPDLGHDVPGMVRCADHDSFPIPERTARWFREHGGTPALLRALRSYMRTHAGNKQANGKARRSSTSAPRARR